MTKPRNLFEDRGIPLRWQGAFLSKLEPREGQEAAHAALLALDVTKHHGIYLYGRQGRGKSLMAAALVREIMDGSLADLDVPEMISWRALLRNQKGQFEAEIAYFDKLPRLCRRRLLVIDDFGAGVISDWANNIAEELLDERYGSMLPTVITSNLTIKEVSERMGSRVASRVTGLCATVIKVEGVDHRRTE